MGSRGSLKRRLVQYILEASISEENVAREHPCGREAVHALEIVLSRRAEENATPILEGKRFVRSIRPEVTPPQC